MHVPAGFAAVAPYLMVRDAPAYLDFLVAGLGGTHLGTTWREPGVVANAQVRWGDGPDTATIMVGEARRDADVSRIDLMLYVPNADAALDRAVAAGARLLMAASDQSYGDRQGGITDAWGVTWWISQRVVAGPYAFD